MDCLTDSEKSYLLHLLLSCDTKPDFNYVTVMHATGMASVGGARNKVSLILKKLRRERNLIAAWERGVVPAVAVAPAASTVVSTDSSRERKAEEEEEEEEGSPARKGTKKEKKGAE